MDEKPDQIKIVGRGDKLFPYEKVKASVVKIGSEFYLRHDEERVVWIKNLSGKLRAYRRTSPLLCKDAGTGEVFLRSDAVMTEEGIWIKKTDAVYIDDKPYRKAYCVKVRTPLGDKYYLKSSPEIGQCRVTDAYCLKSELVELSVDFYKRGRNLVNVSELASGEVVKTINNQLILRGDAVRIYNFDTGGFDYEHACYVGSKTHTDVVIDFQDKTNPQSNRLEIMKAPLSQLAEKACVFSFDPSLPSGEAFDPTPRGILIQRERGYYIIPKNKLDYFITKTKEYIYPRFFVKMEDARSAINKTFSDLDPDENKARVFRIIPEPYHGKQNIYTASSFGNPVKSNLFSKTGGLEYSFGVEFETSNGLLHDAVIEKLGVSCVGDRSVGAGEYVTSPLQGNDGIRKIEEICEALNATTLVDDRCGLHVHVGTLENRKLATSIQAPSFDKQFLMNSIRLGAYLERELFESLPPNRKPTLYHCHSIQRYKYINADNFDVVLGAFIFGPREWWLTPTNSCPIKLFNFDDYALGPGRNRRSSLGTWAEGRYKWLNLIPSFTASRHRTIEFRIFSGTTVFEKTYAAILTSLAFTYVADNCGRAINPAIKLADVFDLAFTRRGHGDIAAFLNDFYTRRKAKFKRKNIYPALDLPFLKDIVY